MVKVALIHGPAMVMFAEHFRTVGTEHFRNVGNVLLADSELSLLDQVEFGVAQNVNMFVLCVGSDEETAASLHVAHYLTTLLADKPAAQRPKYYVVRRGGIEDFLRLPPDVMQPYDFLSLEGNDEGAAQKVWDMIISKPVCALSRASTPADQNWRHHCHLVAANHRESARH